MQGAEIVQLILDHGKLRPPDIVSQLTIHDPVKGMCVSIDRLYGMLRMLLGPAVYSQVLHKLVESSYLKPATILSHQSPQDKRIKYETEEKAKISGFPTAKQIREAKEVAEARLRREEEEAEKIGMVRFCFLVFCFHDRGVSWSAI